MKSFTEFLRFSSVTRLHKMNIIYADLSNLRNGVFSSNNKIQNILGLYVLNVTVMDSMTEFRIIYAEKLCRKFSREFSKMMFKEYDTLIIRSSDRDLIY